ncbi:MAG: hypothetical protein QHH04_03790 [Methanolinea sp.]|nr:hypothetical protein [Methanolinea sp.]
MEQNRDYPANGVTVHPGIHEVTFWKTFSVLRKMIRHLEERELLIATLAKDPTLPEKTRDEVTAFLKSEQAENLSAFHDFLVNFITIGLQGLHRTGITLEFSFQENGTYRVLRACLHVDGKPLPLPDGEGQRLFSIISPVLLSGDDPGGALIAFYKSCEEMHDRERGYSLDSCSLELTREIYPGTSFHARLRLPAYIFCRETPSGN